MDHEQINWKKISSEVKRGKDKITITKSKSIGFSEKMYEDNKIQDYKYVSIFYNKIGAALGFRFTNDENEQDTFKIIHRKQQKGASVKAVNLFNQEHIDAVKYQGQYDYTKQQVEGIGEFYVIYLKEKKTATDTSDTE